MSETDNRSTEMINRSRHYYCHLNHIDDYGVVTDIVLNRVSWLLTSYWCQGTKEYLLISSKL